LVVAKEKKIIQGSKNVGCHVLPKRARLKNNLYFDTMALVKFARSSHLIIGPLAARN
jgi:hypothetical protein